VQSHVHLDFFFSENPLKQLDAEALRDIFVYGEIIKIHTIHECDYTVTKLPHNGNTKAKKINKK